MAYTKKDFPLELQTVVNSDTGEEKQYIFMKHPDFPAEGMLCVSFYPKLDDNSIENQIAYLKGTSDILDRIHVKTGTYGMYISINTNQRETLSW